MKRALLAGVLLAGVVTGLWGLGWGLPGPARMRAFPTAMTPEAARKFSDAWARLYARIKAAHQDMSDEPATYVHGVDEIGPGGEFPQPRLLNAYRAMLLQSTNPDEKKSFIILAQMHPRRLEFKPLYIFYGGAYIYPLGAFLGAGALVRAVTVVSDMSHYLQHPEDMGRMYRWGRLFMILFNLATLWVLFDMGCRAGDEQAGFWAALFFCLSPIVISNSHLLKPHPIGAFWCLLALRYSMMAFEGGKRRDYLTAGVCFGLGGGAVFPFAAFAWLPFLVWLERRATKRAVRGEFASMTASGAAAVFFFFLTNPYLAVARQDFRWDFSYYVPQGAARGGSLEGLLSVFSSAGGSLGAALSALSLAGLGLALFRKERGPRWLAWSFLALFATLWILFGRLYTFGLNGTGIRYYYPIFGLACLLAGLALRSAPRRWRAALIAVVLLDTGMRGGAVLLNMSAGSGPRSAMNRAADWIEANVPAGAAVGLARYPEPSHTPPFRYDRYRLVVFDKPESVKAGSEPRFLVVDGEAMDAYKNWIDAHYDRLRSFEPIQLGWAKVVEFPCYANPAAYVYRLKTP